MGSCWLALTMTSASTRRTAMRADELLAEDDSAGARNYREIVHRINRLVEKPAGRLH
jgi:hypothetical protein